MEVEGLNTKHLATGSPEPPKPGDGKMRVYNMRFCPYAQRVLLTLKLKHIPFEVINVNTKEKPAWYLEKKNPLGKVPTVEQDGKIVYESLVCADYLDENIKSGRQLLPNDSYEKAKQKMLVERLSALASAYYTYLYKRQDPAAIKNYEDVLKLAESLLEKDYFAGKEPGYVDFMTWPFIERLAAVDIISNGQLAVSPDKYPKFAAYIDRMRNIPEIKAILLDGPTHVRFLEGYVAGKPDFDFMF